MSLGMCLGTASVRCPNCKQIIETNRPDSSRPCWSLHRPDGREVVGKALKQVLECRTKKCGGRITVIGTTENS